MTKSPKVLRVQPLREQVLETLLAALHQGRFPPGDRLTEEGVAAYLGVSRTPVREALGILAQRGIIARRTGGGFVVPNPGARNIEDSFELRRLIEPYAVRRVARNITDKQLAELREGLAHLRFTVEHGGAVEVTQANMEFRRLMFSFTDNDALTRAIAQVTDHVQLIGTLTMNSAKVRRLVLAKHEKVLKAIAARNADAAEKAMLDYLEAARVAAHDAVPNAVS